MGATNHSTTMWQNFYTAPTLSKYGRVTPQASAHLNIRFHVSLTSIENTSNLEFPKF
ncbi:hypothetical protein CY34DRAFT_808465 [Suillus luteus UH-Slu-Lm8-n1]|uniref:Uncharacterized protein n=1 Tax=Suillus luteus UH-Slu-Lm8-n1 TaxID=930992 RepID=A0A0D0B610_9AGAM|nr:hypothetical protein CY34DRAFT_808465 [Suillus luteus UH-Slu-Lm8-n1]